MMDLLWLFFMLSALQPVLQRRYLEAMRVRKIAQIVSRRDGYELGRVLQLNEVPMGSLSRAWGQKGGALARLLRRLAR